MVERPTCKEVEKRDSLFEQELISHRHLGNATKEGEEPCRTVGEEQRDLIIRFKPDGTLIFVNEAFCRFFKIGRADLAGKTWHSLIASRDVEVIEEKLKFLSPANPGGFIKKRISSCDGEHRWCQFAICGIFNDESQICEIQLVGRDITERIKGEEELKKSRQRLAQIIDFLPDATFVTDTKGRVVAWNRAIENMSGVKAEDMLGKGNYEYAIPFHGRRRPAAIDLIVNPDTEAEKRFEYVVRDGDALVSEIKNSLVNPGCTLWNKASLLYDDNGNVMGAIQSLRDISDRKAAEKALQESESLYRLLVENLHEGIWRVDQNARTTFVNSRMAELLGYSKEEMEKKSIFSFMDDAGIEIAREYLEHGKQGVGSKKQHEFELIRKDGKRVCTLMSISPVFGADGIYKGMIAGIVDISDRKASEQKLREREEQLRMIAENTGLLIGVLDSRGVYEYANSAHRMLGYRPDELLGVSGFTLIHSEDADRLSGLMQKGQNGQISSIRTVCTVQHKDGQTLFVEGTFDPIRNSKGELEKIVFVGNDITERKRLEEKLAHEREMLDMVIEGTHAGTWEWYVQTGETVYNERWAEILGYMLEELRPFSRQTWCDLCHPDDLKCVYDLLEEHFSGNLPYYECECRMRHKEGHWVWINDRGKVVRWSKEGKPVLMTGTRVDITGRKKAEQALRESEEKYRNFLNTIDDGAFETDDGGNLTYVNRAALEIARKPARDLLGRPFLPLFTEASQRVGLWVYTRSLNGEDVGIYELEFTNGRSCQFRNAPLRDKSGKIIGVSGILRDITERKKAEKGLLRRDAILQAVNFEAEKFIRSGLLEDETVNEVLACLGESANVSCVYVFKNYSHKNGALHMRRLHEWTAPGITPRLDYLGRSDLPYRTAGFDRWEKDLSRGESIQGCVGDFPQGERAVLVSEGIQSILVVPVFVGQEWWGYMGFDEYQTEREWLQMEVDALKTAASILGLAIERKYGEARVIASLKEKEVLLREIHHRVKNNMQVTSSLLNLQSRQVTDPKVGEIFKESETRIKAMALVHDKLYRSEDLANIRFKEYVEDLVRNQLVSYGVNTNDISVALEMEDLFLGIDIATPCGMIINELVANSLKYAFPNDKT